MDELREAAVSAVGRDVARYHIVFVQAGAAHAPMCSALRSLGDACLQPAEFLAGDADARGLVVIDNLESLGESGGPEMSRLRAKVLDGVDAGSRFVLLSRFPKARYERVPGSSLLLDARSVVLPVGDFGSKEDDSSGVWPACFAGSSTVQEVACQIFEELGLEVGASLDHIIFESFMPRASLIDLLSDRETDALHGSGLLRLHSGNYVWSIPNRFGEIATALASSLAQAVAPQHDLSAAFTELWSLERVLRKRIRDRLSQTHGDGWKSQCLHGDLEQKVLGRAREDVYAGAKSIKEIRDPLEWLSLGELLEVRERSGVGEMGVEPVVWEKFRREVGPVRNRISHMRLLRAGDLDTARRWSAILSRKLT